VQEEIVEIQVLLHKPAMAEELDMVTMVETNLILHMAVEVEVEELEL
jgi:hypothetical protein